MTKHRMLLWPVVWNAMPPLARVDNADHVNTVLGLMRIEILRLADALHKAGVAITSEPVPVERPVFEHLKKLGAMALVEMKSGEAMSGSILDHRTALSDLIHAVTTYREDTDVWKEYVARAQLSVVHPDRLLWPTIEEKPPLPKPAQEFDKDGRHRLVASDGRSTHWAPYIGTTYLDGWVGHTAYFSSKEGVSTPHEFMMIHGYQEVKAEEHNANETN